MKRKNIVLKCLIAGFLSILSFGNKAQADDHLPVLHFQKLHDAIVDGNAQAFASMVKYPIMREYPLKNIGDSAQMVAYFPTLIDDSLRAEYRNVKPEDWDDGGWRGYTDGNFWDDGTGIYSIEYSPRAERQLRARLVKDEIASLHSSLQRGDIDPAACLYDSATHAVLRVDKIVDGDEDSGKYRVCLYKNVNKLDKAPDYIYEAISDVEGSAGIQWFECYRIKGGKRVHVMDFTLDLTDSPEGCEADILVGKKKGKRKFYPTYWLDLLQSH